MRRIIRDNTGSMLQGQDLVAAGYAGWSGTVRAVKACRSLLQTKYTSQYLDHILETGNPLLCGQLEKWTTAGATECEPAGEGGMCTALWNLSGAYMRGISFDLRKIPVRQATIEICEFFDMNPYRLDSAGCLLFAADNGGDLVKVLEGRGTAAAVIGKVTEGIGRVIEHGGSHGYLDRPAEDEIHKVINRRS